jgi:hypothetical protein
MEEPQNPEVRTQNAECKRVPPLEAAANGGYFGDVVSVCAR